MITVRKGFSKGFAPDLPDDDPEALGWDATQGGTSNCIPSMFGMERAPSPATAVAATVGAVGDQALRGAKMLTKLNGTTRVFAAHLISANAIVSELVSGTWTARSATFTGVSDVEKVSFAQFGDTSFFVSIDVGLNSSTSGAFSSVTNGPKARIMEPVLTSGGGFLMLFNTDDTTYGVSPDRWWCSSLNDASSSTAWTPSIATQCATGRLLGYQGSITAARQLGGDKIVAYKDNAAYVGQYVGPPGIWAWQEFPGIGCVGEDAVCDVNGIHFVVSKDDLFFFDGVRPRSVGDNIRQFWRNVAPEANRWGTTVLFDKEKGLIRVFATSTSYGIENCFVYNIHNGKWGDDAVAAASGIALSPIVYTSADANTKEVAAYFNVNNQLMTLDGAASGNSYLVLPAIGDDGNITTLKEIRLKFSRKPTTANIRVSQSMAFGASRSFAFTQDSYDIPGDGDNVFKLRSTARWHFVFVTLTGDYEILGYEYDLVPSGKR